jgi:SpoVK/Ycf46/Vps4 family AAA+-type ATPase
MPPIQLNNELEKNYELFVKEFTNYANAFDGIKDFTQKMIGKGYILNQTSDYLSSIIYFSIALWTYSIEPSKTTDGISALRKMIQQTRDKYKASMAVEDQNDGVKMKPVNEENMIDKMTNKVWSFETMSGASKEKRTITNKFIRPNLYKHLFLSDTNNVLLYGPPGTGKTVLAKASVGELNRAAKGAVEFLFYEMTADKLRSKWEGGTEKNIASMFLEASQEAGRRRAIYEKQNKNTKVKSVLFLDEVEAIAKSRQKGGSERSVTTLLQQMEGLDTPPDVIVMAATNYPWELDGAFVRRFSSRVFVDLSDFVARIQLIFSTIIGKYEKHGDSRRLLSLRLIPDGSKSQISKQYKDYKYIKNDDQSSVIISYEINRTLESINDTQNLTKPIMNELRHISGKEINEDIMNYTCYAMLAVCSSNIKKNPEQNINWRKWVSKQTVEFLNLIKFIFFISDLTGPNKAIHNQMKFKSSISKRYTDMATTKYGYSASDLTKVVSEFFNLTAEEIIDSTFILGGEQRCGAVDNFIDASNCYVRLIDESKIKESGTEGLFSSLESSRTKDAVYLTNESKDMYTVFVPEIFDRALDAYKSTTGNEDNYCDYVEYEQTGAEPNSMDKCSAVVFNKSSETSQKKEVGDENVTSNTQKKNSNINVSRSIPAQQESKEEEEEKKYNDDESTPTPTPIPITKARAKALGKATRSNRS